MLLRKSLVLPRTAAVAAGRLLVRFLLGLVLLAVVYSALAAISLIAMYSDRKLAQQGAPGKAIGRSRALRSLVMRNFDSAAADEFADYGVARNELVPGELVHFQALD